MVIRKYSIDLFWFLFKRPIFIFSYPKSGSTLVRLFIFNLFRIRDNKEISFSHDELNYFMPEFGKGTFFRADRYRFLKSHRIFFPTLFKHLIVIRNPFDSLCSYFEYNKRIDSNFSLDINSFLLSKKGINFYSQHLKLASRSNGLVIVYEDFIENKVAFIKGLFEFLSFSYTEDEVDKLVKGIDRNKQILIESRSGLGEVKNFSKEKNYDRYKELISGENLKVIESLDILFCELRDRKTNI
ncbi:sulfotransferase domain-containing protein [Cyclobacterium xiamenense]|uniref:sulfotransferase domain-containing protein n=1 Tax=Cyclobacterium xiamenense TaxID=1297121 RepID=UPI0012B811EA|nr:sulfotransferase domain-containing protein [Cyclobacterium xiamenense]